MDFLSLTQSNWFLVGPVAKVLGVVMNGIYEFLDMFGIASIGLAIILFTIIIKALMLPLSIKQQKFTKLNSIMAPELQQVQKKYANLDKSSPKYKNDLGLDLISGARLTRLLQRKSDVLTLFDYNELVLTSQPAHSQIKLLVGLNLCSLLKVLCTHCAVLAEGCPNSTCNTTTLLNHFKQFLLLIIQYLNEIYQSPLQS